MRLNSIYHWFFGLEDQQQNIIRRQAHLKHLVCKQIRESHIKLKPHQIPIPRDKKKKKK